MAGGDRSTIFLDAGEYQINIPTLVGMYEISDGPGASATINQSDYHGYGDDYEITRIEVSLASTATVGNRRTTMQTLRGGSARTFLTQTDVPASQLYYYVFTNEANEVSRDNIEVMALPAIEAFDSIAFSDGNAVDGADEYTAKVFIRSRPTYIAFHYGGLQVRLPCGRTSVLSVAHGSIIGVSIPSWLDNISLFTPADYPGYITISRLR
jgi:hypothetical protein